MADKHSAGRGWTWFFWSAALFNFLIGVAVILGPAAHIDTRLAGILIFAFGIVYAVTARDPERFSKVLWAGVFGKIAVVSLLVSAGIQQSGSSAPSAVLAIDILFAFGFLLFLLTRSDERAEAEPVGVDRQGEQ